MDSRVSRAYGVCYDYDEDGDEDHRGRGPLDITDDYQGSESGRFRDKLARTVTRELFGSICKLNILHSRVLGNFSTINLRLNIAMVA